MPFPDMKALSKDDHEELMRLIKRLQDTVDSLQEKRERGGVAARTIQKATEEVLAAKKEVIEAVEAHQRFERSLPGSALASNLSAFKPTALKLDSIMSSYTPGQPGGRRMLERMEKVLERYLGIEEESKEIVYDVDPKRQEAKPKDPSQELSRSNPANMPGEYVAPSYTEWLAFRPEKKEEKKKVVTVQYPLPRHEPLRNYIDFNPHRTPHTEDETPEEVQQRDIHDITTWLSEVTNRVCALFKDELEADLRALLHQLKHPEVSDKEARSLSRFGGSKEKQLKALGEENQSKHVSDKLQTEVEKDEAPKKDDEDMEAISSF